MVPTYKAVERAGTADVAPATKRRDGRSRLSALKTSSAAFCFGDGACSKAVSRPRSSGAIRAAPLPRMKALHTLQGTKDMHAQIE